MTNIRRSVLFCTGIALMLIIQGCTESKTMQTIVTFGMQPPGGGPCAGNGICTAVLADGTVAAPERGVKVTFAVNPAVDKNILILTYSFAELDTKDHAQAEIIRGLTADAAMPCPVEPAVTPAPPTPEPGTEGDDNPVLPTPDPAPDARAAPAAITYKFKADYPLPDIIRNALSLPQGAKIACTSPIIVTRVDDRVTMYVRYYNN